MHQESVDKLKGGVKSDTLLFIFLIVFFFAAGGISAYLKMKFQSSIPIYIFALIMGVLIYVYYRLRILGYRYTIFYKEPEPEFDPRFNDYMIHEDYPYPVGTFVAERTASAKGTVICVIERSEIVKLLDPGEEYSADTEVNCSPKKKKDSSSIVYNKDGSTVRMYYAPTDELKDLIRGMIENGKTSDL